jgi:hypothetical protein
MKYREIVSFVFSIVLIFISSCGSDTETQPKAQSEWRGDTSAFTESFEFRDTKAVPLLYEKTQSIPFSGSLEIKKSNGDLSKEHYLKGVRNGLQVKRSLSGARSEATYVDGLLHGYVVTYDRQGRERTRMYYVRGTLAKLNYSSETNGSKPD